MYVLTTFVLPLMTVMFANGQFVGGYSDSPTSATSLNNYRFNGGYYRGGGSSAASVPSKSIGDYGSGYRDCRLPGGFVRVGAPIGFVTICTPSGFSTVPVFVWPGAAFGRLVPAFVGPNFMSLRSYGQTSVRPTLTEYRSFSPGGIYSELGSYRQYPSTYYLNEFSRLGGASSTSTGGNASGDSSSGALSTSGSSFSAVITDGSSVGNSLSAGPSADGSSIAGSPLGDTAAPQIIRTHTITTEVTTHRPALPEETLFADAAAVNDASAGASSNIGTSVSGDSSAAFGQVLTGGSEANAFGDAFSTPGAAYRTTSSHNPFAAASSTGTSSVDDSSYNAQSGIDVTSGSFLNVAANVSYAHPDVSTGTITGRPLAQHRRVSNRRRIYRPRAGTSTGGNALPRNTAQAEAASIAQNSIQTQRTI